MLRSMRLIEISRLRPVRLLGTSNVRLLDVNTDPNKKDAGVESEQNQETTFSAETSIDSGNATTTIDSYSIPLTNHPLLSYMVNLMMRDGKKERARGYLQTALQHVRERTKEDPIEYLGNAIDKVAPLTRNQSNRKGAKVIVSPLALNDRQRTFRAIKWILEESDKHRKLHKSFGKRIGEELIAITEGTSGALQKQHLVHRTSIENRSNIRF